MISRPEKTKHWQRICCNRRHTSDSLLPVCQTSKIPESSEYNCCPVVSKRLSLIVFASMLLIFNSTLDTNIKICGKVDDVVVAWNQKHIEDRGKLIPGSRIKLPGWLFDELSHGDENSNCGELM